MSSSASVVSSVSDNKEQVNITTNQLFPAFSQLEGGGQSIDTGQQFLQWLHQVETSLVAEQSLPYQRFIKELERQLVVTSGLEKEVGDSLALLESLSSQYCMVSEKTTSLHLACQHLLEEQTKLADLLCQRQGLNEKPGGLTGTPEGGGDQPHQGREDSRQRPHQGEGGVRV